jgi:hypothetical protein
MRWFQVSSDLEGEGEGKERRKKDLRIGTVLGHISQDQKAKARGIKDGQKGAEK